MHVLDVDECNMPCVCENVSMSDNPHDCDAIVGVYALKSNLLA